MRFNLIHVTYYDVYINNNIHGFYLENITRNYNVKLYFHSNTNVLNIRYINTSISEYHNSDMLSLTKLLENVSGETVLGFLQLSDLVESVTTYKKIENLYNMLGLDYETKFNYQREYVKL